MRHFMRCFALLFAATIANAATPVDDYLDDGTFLVASLDLELATADESTDWIVATLDTLSPETGATARHVRGELSELRDLGISDARLILGIDDIATDGGPLVVTKLLDEAAASRARGWLEPRLAKLKDLAKVRQHGATLRVARPATLDRYEKLTATRRPDLTEPLAGDAALAAIVSPGADARRVLRELWPTLPPPYDKLTGTLLADDLGRITASVQLTASARGWIAAESSSSHARQVLADTLVAARGAGVAWLQSQQDEVPSTVVGAARSLTPELGEDCVTVEVVLTEELRKQLVAEVVAPAINEAQQHARREPKLTNMKQVLLAMHNFHDVIGFFPEAIVDGEGHPLLSWRVALLPFIDMALFEKFHLDEPWDSPHNLQVAKESAPDCYCRGNGMGMTTYQRPTYPGSNLAAARGETAPIEQKLAGRSCHFAPGDRFAYLTDGTSQTIMIAEVAPEHAVFWTKPEDWEVDLKDPLAKLRTDKREGFVTGYYDGSARFEPFDIDPKLLKKLITKNGGEPIER